MFNADVYYDNDISAGKIKLLYRFYFRSSVFIINEVRKCVLVQQNYNHNALFRVGICNEYESFFIKFSSNALLIIQIFAIMLIYACYLPAHSTSQGLKHAPALLINHE